MTREEEAEFIAPFVDMARKGQLVERAQIGKILEERVGCPLHHWIIYRLLDGNGWRKVCQGLFTKNPTKRPRTILKKLPEKIEQILADREPEDKRPVVYVSQDESRFGRISEPQNCWAPKGI